MKLLLQYENGENERLSTIIKNKTYDDLTDEDLKIIIKTCSKCKTEKILNEYVKSKKGLLGRHSICKSCSKEYSTEYYLKATANNLKTIVKIM